MSPRPPADAIVALRSLRRRWRGLFAGLDDDESPDDLARRRDATGRSALDHATHAAGTIALLGRALEQTLVSEQPTLDPAVGDADRPPTDAPASTTVEGALDHLALEAEALAARADRRSAQEWSRTASTAGGASVSALDLLWEAVDTAVTDLKGAERTLREVRGR